MKPRTIILITITFLLLQGTLQAQPRGYENNWHQWRGPTFNGIALNGNPPLEWSETKNIAWKIEIPGKGHATPIVWGDRIYIVTAVPFGEKQATQSEGEQQGRSWMNASKADQVHRYQVLSVNREDGKIIWQTTVKEEFPQESTHELGSWASHSPVTDGDHIYAYFGSRGLYCLDMDGKVIWERDFGQLDKRMSFGEGSSPALYKDRLFLVWDHEGESFIVAIDKKTGKDIWRTPRDERTSWATPKIVSSNGKDQVVVSATRRIRSYDPAEGRLIWEATGLTQNVIPCPVADEERVYLFSGYRGNAALAIRYAVAKGDITGTDAIAWQADKDTPYTPSPVLMNNRLYFLRANNGIFSCYNAATGEPHYTAERLEGMGNLYTSPVGVDDRVYVLGQNGLMFILKDGSQFEVIATNKLEGTFNASPVIVGNDLYLRSYTHLYCIRGK